MSDQRMHTRRKNAQTIRSRLRQSPYGDAAHLHVPSSNTPQQSCQIIPGVLGIIQVQQDFQLGNAHMAVPFLNINTLISAPSTQRPAPLSKQHQASQPLYAAV